MVGKSSQVRCQVEDPLTEATNTEIYWQFNVGTGDVVSTKSNQYSANESALGYLYQCRLGLWYALGRLRDRNDIEVAIESLDDVTFSAEGKAEELLQTKHHISAKASLTDACPDLWKTLRIWASQIQLIREGVRLFLITTATASPGSAASLIRDDKSRDVTSAHKKLLTTVATSTNQTNKDAYDAFNALVREDQVALLDAVTVIDSSPNVLDVREKIESELRLAVRPKHLGAFTDRLEGWWYGRVVQNLAHKDGGVILARELHSQIADLREQFLQDNLPIDFENVFPEEDVVKAMLGKPFVEQLRLVALTETRIRHAVTDYYQAFEQRSRWLREDLLLVGDLEQYETRLVKEWERSFERIKQNYEVEEEPKKAVAGRAVFDWAESANIYIRPQCQQPYIHRGSFQILADKLKIGWHPEFVARLEHLLTSVESIA